MYPINNDQCRRDCVFSYELDKIADDEEIDEHDYSDWEYDEMQRVRCSSLKWVRARYSVDDHVDLAPMPEYTVDIPSDFLLE